MPTTLVVNVDGRVMPWWTVRNPAYRYGLNDGLLPLLVYDALVPGQVVTFTATGTVKPSDSRPLTGPAGAAPPTGSTGGSTGTGFPTRYMPGSNLGLCGLCGMFALPGGFLTQALSIGAANSFISPVGGPQIFLGINDDHFKDNTGHFIVTINISDPPVYERTWGAFFDLG